MSRSCAPPGSLHRQLRRSYSGIDIRRIATRDLGEGLALARIDDGDRRAAGGFDPLPGDQQAGGRGRACMVMTPPPPPPPLQTSVQEIAEEERHARHIGDHGQAGDDHEHEWNEVLDNALQRHIGDLAGCKKIHAKGRRNHSQRKI